MANPRVLITGINGKVGQALVRAFSGEWDISGIDIQAAPGVLAADLSDWRQADRAFSQTGDIDYVIHLAAIADSRASWDDVLRHNIIATRNVYECAASHGAKRVIFASSWHVVGGYQKELADKPGLVVATTDPLRPDGDYATSKAFGEALARQYWEQSGLRSVCLRIGNIEANDRPRDAFAGRIWLSHRDLAQLVAKSISSDIDFGIYFATSRNAGRFLDLSTAERELGYRPQDDASQLGN